MTYNSAQEKLFDVIEKAAAETSTANINTPAKALAIANLALALRYTVGGPQPGGHPSSS